MPPKSQHSIERVIREWFYLVQVTIMQYGIAYEDIYNFTETDYAMGPATMHPL